MGHKIEIHITDNLLEKILSYGDKSLGDLTPQQIEKILKQMETGLLSRIEDEPHYAYEDFVDGII
jgi:hypothetical protein